AYGLTPALVTAHLATATLFVGMLSYTTVGSFALAAPIQGPLDRETRLAWGAAAAAFAPILVGGVVRGEGAGLAFSGWPLMDGRVIPPLGSFGAVLHFAHRLLAVAVGIVVVLLAVRLWPYRRTRTPAAILAAAAVGLFFAQVLLGAANVWTKLAVAPVVGHVAVSSLLFGVLVAAAAASRACACKERAATHEVADRVPVASSSVHA
ncbi:MAG: heme A synthase, partial [Actinomycetota bacterium]